MEKFRVLKIDTNLFNNFFSKFIYLTLDLEYISEILIWEYNYKLTPCFQDWLNSEVELPTFISALAKYCLSIYE